MSPRWWFEFQLEIKINEASQDARAKINTIRKDLPQDIEEPVIQKIDISGMPAVSLAVRSESLSPRDLTTLVEKKVKRSFENISGVGKVELVGSSKREVNIWIDPFRLQALNLGVDEVIAGLQSENVNIPLGRLNRNGSEFSLRVSGKPVEVEQFKSHGHRSTRRPPDPFKRSGRCPGRHGRTTFPGHDQWHTGRIPQYP